MAKFKAGESGNPGGRPAGYGEIRDIARKHTGPAIDTLVKIMNDADATPSARVGAATALLDRGWGRPTQTIEATITPYVCEADPLLSASMLELLDDVRIKDTPSLKTSENFQTLQAGGNA